MVVSKYVIFLKKEFVLERSEERKIDLEEVQEPQTDVQKEPKHKAIILDIIHEAQEK